MRELDWTEDAIAIASAKAATATAPSGPCAGYAGASHAGNSLGGDASARAAWTVEDVAELERCELILAADCVYDDDLTDALFAVLSKTLRMMRRRRARRPPRAMCAMERRVNFGVNDEEPRAHAFERFLLHLGLKPDGVELAPLSDVPAESRGVFRGRRLDLFEVPQRVMYDRVGELELWEVTLVEEDKEDEEDVMGKPSEEEVVKVITTL